MGKVKLDIKKLENSSSRQATYSKRKHGILKKAQELSILCDIDLALVMFSPGGKPSVCCGKHSIEEVIARLNQLPPQERTKRKLEGLEALKKQYRKSDHDVNIEDFCTSAPTIKGVNDQAARLKSRLAELHERLWYWTNPGVVSDFGLLTQMENSLEKSLNQIQREKENFQKRQRVSLENQLKDDTQLSFQAIDEHQLQSLLWPPSDNLQHMVLTQEPKLHSQREIESCTGSTSGSYFGCLSTSSKSEATSPGQQSGIDNIGQDAFQGLQFGGLYSYLPHGLNMQNDNNNFQAMLSMDQQQNTLTSDAGRNYQLTLPCQDLSNHLPLDTSTAAAAAFAGYSNYQKPTVPAPAIPTIYERMAADSNNLMFDYTPNH